MLDDPTCWVNQHFIVWPPCLMTTQHVGWCWNMFDAVSNIWSNISLILMLDAWNFVSLAGLNNMLHVRMCIRTANSAVTIDTVCSRQCSLKMSASEEAAQNINQTSSKKTPKQKARRWSDEETDHLIDLLEGNRCLWDVFCEGRAKNFGPSLFSIAWQTSLTIYEIAALVIRNWKLKDLKVSPIARKCWMYVRYRLATS